MYAAIYGRKITSWNMLAEPVPHTSASADMELKPQTASGDGLSHFLEDPGATQASTWGLKMGLENGPSWWNSDQDSGSKNLPLWWYELKSTGPSQHSELAIRETWNQFVSIPPSIFVKAWHAADPKLGPTNLNKPWLSFCSTWKLWGVRPFYPLIISSCSHMFLYFPIVFHIFLSVPHRKLACWETSTQAKTGKARGSEFSGCLTQHMGVGMVGWGNRLFFGQEIKGAACYLNHVRTLLGDVLGLDFDTDPSGSSILHGDTNVKGTKTSNSNVGRKWSISTKVMEIPITRRWFKYVYVYMYIYICRIPIYPPNQLGLPPGWMFRWRTWTA